MYRLALVKSSRPGMFDGARIQVNGYELAIRYHRPLPGQSAGGWAIDVCKLDGMVRTHEVHHDCRTVAQVNHVIQFWSTMPPEKDTNPICIGQQESATLPSSPCPEDCPVIHDLGLCPRNCLSCEVCRR